MLDLIVKAKEIQLKSGRVMTIERAGVGFFYRLLAAFIFANSHLNLNADLENMTVEEISDVLKELLKFDVDYKIAMKNLQFFVKEKLPKLTKEEEAEVLQEVFKFNTPKFWKQDGDSETTLNKVNSSFNFMIANVIKATGWTLDYVLTQVDNVQLYCLFKEFLNIRSGKIVDMYVAHNADNKQLDKYRLSLVGGKTMSMQEAIEEAKRLKENG